MPTSPSTSRSSATHVTDGDSTKITIISTCRVRCVQLADYGAESPNVEKRAIHCREGRIKHPSVSTVSRPSAKLLAETSPATENYGDVTCSESPSLGRRLANYSD